MISYLLEAPRVGDQESEERRIRNEQRLNSMSAQEIEALYSRADLRSGLMKISLTRPEHKLRDLARNVLGKTSAELGELDIYQVGRLFFNRRMTFSFDQLANVAYRRKREWGACGLLSPASHEEQTRSGGKLLFLIHDEQQNVSVVTMQDENDYFPCTVASLKEGPLFENVAVPIVLRHPNPHLLWKLWQREKKTSSDFETDAPQLEEGAEITFAPGFMVEHKEDKKKAAGCAMEILKAFRKQNLKVKIGFSILAQQWARTDDERPLFGLPLNNFRADPHALAMDWFMAELRGAMAQMDGEFDLPPQTSAAEKSRRDQKLQMILDTGHTFSIREAGLFMRNAPRLSAQETYAILVHDEQGEVFTLTMLYRKRQLANLQITPANLHTKLNDWSSGVVFCLRTPFMDSTLVISPAAILGRNGKYEFDQ